MNEELEERLARLRHANEEELGTRTRVLEADVRALEEAADAAIEERKHLREDLDTVTTVLTRLIEKLQDERDAAEDE